LTAALRARGLAMDEPLIVARTGWTTDELAAAIDQSRPQGTFDLVSLLIGVNNQYRGYSLDEYRNEFGELLRRAIAFAGERPASVIVISIPDWGVTPFAAGRDRARIAAEIDAFNQVNRAEAERAGARYVDVTGVSRRVAELPSLLAGDGLHPSAEMYAAWVERILSEALLALQP
jgi:lysophospholipase L1-like esterase